MIRCERDGWVVGGCVVCLCSTWSRGPFVRRGQVVASCAFVRRGHVITRTLCSTWSRGPSPSKQVESVSKSQCGMVRQCGMEEMWGTWGKCGSSGSCTGGRASWHSTTVRRRTCLTRVPHSCASLMCLELTHVPAPELPSCGGASTVSTTAATATSFCAPATDNPGCSSQVAPQSCTD